jgi:hypothetical protein
MKGALQDVVTGFLDGNDQTHGRPVGLAVDRGGVLLIADDVGNRVWHVSSARRPPLPSRPRSSDLRPGRPGRRSTIESHHWLPGGAAFSTDKGVRRTHEDVRRNTSRPIVVDLSDRHRAEKP